MHTTRIKICGITRRQDAEAAVAAGADALGLVFYPGSPRHVTPKTAHALAADLPPFVSLVGLFVNATPAEILYVAASGLLTTLQLHGHETPNFCRQLRREAGGALRIIKAIRVATRDDLKQAALYDPPPREPQENSDPHTAHPDTEIQENTRVQALLLDAKVDNRYGGTGQRFDWSLLDAWHPTTPWILAGGLCPDTVAEAIHRTRPYAVDVSSGVESAPGIKDAQKMARLVQQVRHADAMLAHGPSHATPP